MFSTICHGILGGVCRALALVFAPPPLWALVGPSRCSPSLAILPMGSVFPRSSFSNMECSFCILWRRSLLWWFWEDVATSLLLNFGITDGIIEGSQEGQQSVVIMAWSKFFEAATFATWTEQEQEHIWYIMCFNRSGGKFYFLTYISHHLYSDT
ncbi:hypothetical protein DVH24_004326 [Malus domestica]|uniref:Uncharacterized protein n=1 Tax=Malus domestica TaxID=3750 RepID=A0A498KBD8_MALDO|nr:hypothetical protein DVH24_004326 [Malus domestica]